MVFSDEDLISQVSIVIQATLPTVLVSFFDTKHAWPYIRINDSTISRILKHQCGVTHCVAFPLAGECAMQLYFMASTAPMQQFVLHSQLTTSMMAWGIGSKVIMTGIGLSPSHLTLAKIPLINNWRPSLMKWFGTWWPFSTLNRHSCWV